MTINYELFTATREAEQALLGSILIEGSRGTREAIDQVRATIESGDFLDSRFPDNLHSRIFAAMLSCSDPPDQISVAHEMAKQGTIKPGDCAYLLTLIADCPCSLDYPYYAKAISEYSLQRRLQYRVDKADFDTAKKLLDKHSKAKYTGGIKL